MSGAIGTSARRVEAWEKVTGKAVYTDDLPTVGLLSARLLTSTRAHAKISSIDTSGALSSPGVRAVLTGADCPERFGPLVLDRPALARDVVRYAGEPVAMVIALTEWEAEEAVRKIRVEYERWRRWPGRPCPSRRRRNRPDRCLWPVRAKRLLFRRRGFRSFP